MAHYPIVLLAGKAGAGKNYLAEKMLISKNYRGASLALADPIKRAVRAMGFKSRTLWGPSEYRNETVKVTTKNTGRFHSSSGGGYGMFREIENAGFNAQDPGAYISFSKVNRYLEDCVYTKKPATARKCLQLLGMGVRDAFGPDVWAKVAIANANKLLTGGYAYTPERGLQEHEKAKPVDYVVITDGRFRNEILSVRAIGGSAVLVRSPETDGQSKDKHVSETELDTIPDFWYNRVFWNTRNYPPDDGESLLEQFLGL